MRILLALLALFLGLACRPKERANSKGKSPQDQQGDTKHPQQIARAEHPSAPTNKTAPHKTVGEETRHRAHERYFWRRQLRAAHCLNWITVIGTVVAAFGLFFVGCSLLLTREAVSDGSIAARAAKTQAQAALDANRPWIKITLEPNDIHWMQFRPVRKSATMVPKITATNVGHLPALNVRAIAIPLLLAAKGESMGDFQRRICASAIDANDVSYQYGKVIFPGDAADLSRQGKGSVLGFFLTPEQFDSVAIKDDSGKKTATGLTVVGCADYSFGNPAEHHQTYFAYDLMFAHRADEVMIRMVEFTEDIDVPAGNMVFLETMTGNYAN